MEELVRERTANLQQRTIELEEEKARTQTLLKGMAWVRVGEQHNDDILCVRSQSGKRGCRDGRCFKAIFSGKHVSW